MPRDLFLKNWNGRRRSASESRSTNNLTTIRICDGDINVWLYDNPTPLLPPYKSRNGDLHAVFSSCSRIVKNVLLRKNSEKKREIKGTMERDRIFISLAFALYAAAIPDFPSSRWRFPVCRKYLARLPSRIPTRVALTFCYDTLLEDEPILKESSRRLYSRFFPRRRSAMDQSEKRGILLTRFCRACESSVRRREFAYIPFCQSSSERSRDARIAERYFNFSILTIGTVWAWKESHRSRWRDWQMFVWNTLILLLILKKRGFFLQEIQKETQHQTRITFVALTRFKCAQHLSFFFPYNKYYNK